MPIYRFRVWLTGGDPDALIDWSNDLYEAGCDDSTPGTVDGRAHTDFHREADTLENAITSALVQVRSTGAEVSQVEPGADDA